MQRKLYIPSQTMCTIHSLLPQRNPTPPLKRHRIRLTHSAQLRQFPIPQIALNIPSRTRRHITDRTMPHTLLLQHPRPPKQPRHLMCAPNWRHRIHRIPYKQYRTRCCVRRWYAKDSLPRRWHDVKVFAHDRYARPRVAYPLALLVYPGDMRLPLLLA
jgi:hypothetical protein